MTRLYAIRVDIYEVATAYKFPVVQHRFLGRTREEAARYHEAHRRSDSFLRECEDKGVFQKQVTCHAVISESWLLS